MASRAFLCLCAWLALLAGCEARGSPARAAAFLSVQEDPEPAADPPAAVPVAPVPAAGEAPGGSSSGEGGASEDGSQESGSASEGNSERNSEGSAERSSERSPASEGGATPPGLMAPSPAAALSPGGAEDASGAAGTASAADETPAELEHMKVDIIFEGIVYSRMNPEQIQYCKDSMVTELSELLGVPTSSIVDNDGVPGSVTLSDGSLIVEARVDLPAGMEVRTARRQIEGERAHMEFEAVANQMPEVEKVIESPIDVEVEVKSVRLREPEPEPAEEAAPPPEEHEVEDAPVEEEEEEAPPETPPMERRPPPPPQPPSGEAETDFGPLDEETSLTDLISAIEILVARQEQAEEDREPFEKSMMRVLHVTAHLYGGLVVIFVPTFFFSLWLIIAFIVAYYFKATRLYPEVELTKRDDDLTGWQTKFFHCHLDPPVFWWSYCCPCVRWADNMGTVGAVKNYWVGWTIFMLLLILNGLLSSLGWALACTVLAFFRGKFRLAFDMPEATAPKTFVQDCVLYFFCWPCAISQEARQVDYACSAGHKSLRGEAGEQLKSILSASEPVKGNFALKQA